MLSSMGYQGSEKYQYHSFSHFIAMFQHLEWDVEVICKVRLQCTVLSLQGLAITIPTPASLQPLWLMVSCSDLMP